MRAFPWQRLAIVLIAAAPLILAAGSFLFLPETDTQQMPSWSDLLFSAFMGVFYAMEWQCAVLFGWFGLICLYVYFADVSFRRCSVSLAIATAIVGIVCMACLLRQQQHIATVLSEIRRD